MKLCDLLSALLYVAEKGAGVARIIRSEPELLQLLVEEKSNGVKNGHVVQDFKTLADVLIQEMVRHDLQATFPGIENNVHGEESAVFTNALGETVCIQLSSSAAETTALLCKILDGNTTVAELLGRVVHGEMAIVAGDEYHHLTQDLDVGSVGVWIDPIDSTAQYMAGKKGTANETGVVKKGLQCVSVLVGAFHQTSGLPIAGVAIQPFWTLHPDTNTWEGRTTWGVYHENMSLSFPSVFDLKPSCEDASSGRLQLVMSSNENPEVVKCLSDSFDLHYASGAGYKLLCVAHGYVDGYVLSKSSIYRWDCCGPHACLLAQGGGILSYSEAKKANFDSDLLCTEEALHRHQIRYCDGKTGETPLEHSKLSGVIAYTSIFVLQNILSALQNLNSVP